MLQQACMCPNVTHLPDLAISLAAGCTMTAQVMAKPNQGACGHTVAELEEACPAVVLFWQHWKAALVSVHVHGEQLCCSWVQLSKRVPFLHKQRLLM